MVHQTSTIVIGKQFRFEAAHSLGGLGEGHQCARTHGHSYTVEVTVSSADLRPPGFVVDFAELKPFRQYIDANLDHRMLNDVLDVEPTAENLATHLAGWFQSHLAEALAVELVAVRVWETATSWAEFRP